MREGAKLLGHPIHPMLIVFPLGLLATSFFFDIGWLVSKAGNIGIVSYWMIIAGVIGGLISAVFGLVDWLAIPSGTRAKAIGAWHGIGNVFVVVLFIGSWLLRRGDPSTPPMLAIVLSAIAVCTALVTGWLGGELVDRLAIGVDEGAHADAPSSLSGRPARDSVRR
ncbi:MAG TPA: DUF2231 domain-containing protein [Thermoanaerobaculia bacterium]|nr:DUF2231 domain-containing protein [Thermoanaerobaculia bacterium]